MRSAEVPVVTCPACGKGNVPCEGTGPVLREERLAHDLTIKDLVESMKLSKTYISDLEGDRRPWNWELVERYRKAMERAMVRRSREAA